MGSGDHLIRSPGVPILPGMERFDIAISLAFLLDIGRLQMICQNFTMLGLHRPYMPALLHRNQSGGKIRSDHFMLKSPPSPTTQLHDDIIALPNQLHIKLDVPNRFARDVDVRNRVGDGVGDFADGRDFEGGTNNDDQVGALGVALREAVEEFLGELLAEEGYVRLHHAGLGDVVVGFGVVVIGRVAAFAARFGPLLGTEGFQRAHVLFAAFAVGDSLCSDVVEDFCTLDFVTAFAACGCCEASVALNETVRIYTGKCFEVINVLGVVGLKSALVLKEANEGVGRSELF